MSERTCIRGCTVKGEHFAACLDKHGRPAEGCKGCQPAEARDGSLICTRCYGRCLGALYDAPDLIAAIRARANPMRAQVYDKVMVSGTLSDDLVPDPVRPELIEASDALTRGLQGWARFIDPASVPARRGLRAGAEADDTLDLVGESTSVIIDALPAIANDAIQIVELCRYLLEQIPGEHFDDCIDPRACMGCLVPGEWTVRAALNRWPLVERPTFSDEPCPYCALRTVKVIRPRRPAELQRDGTWLAKDPEVYECQGCNWTRTDRETDGPWAIVFGPRASGRLR